MTKVKRQGDSPTIPRWFLEELKLIDPDFCPFWDKKAERWLIVRFLPVLEKVPEDVRRRGYIIEYCVSKGKDYTPLDRRTLFSIKMILYLKNRMRELDEHLKDLEDSDDVMAIEAQKAWQIAKREFMKKLWRFEHTETFI